MAGMSFGTWVLIVIAGVLCFLGPLTVLGFMLWKWRKALNTSARRRQVRSTQIR